VPVDVAQVVAETLEMVRGSLPAAVRLEPTAAAFPLLVIGDATQLHQAVMNLCSNAVLALVYAIVIDLGGAIDVKSAVGQGSTFAIYLPQV
jgi:signal transduction histidine kinase